MEYISDHFYKVIRFGDRTTSRAFLSYAEALRYYDQRCKASAEYPIEFQEYVRDRKPYQWTVIYTNTRLAMPTGSEYRNLYKKKKKSNLPFGL